MARVIPSDRTARRESEVEHRELGRLRVTHERDGGRDWLDVHGVHFEIADRDLSDAAFATARAFNLAESEIEQRSQLAIISTIVSEAVRRSPWLEAKIREAKQRAAA